MGYRDRLPQLDADRPFLADGGLETTLIFHRGIDLPHFAAFDLLRTEAGREALRAYFEPYVALAHERRTGMVVDTVTWRANADWGRRLGYSPDDLDDANRAAVALAQEIRAVGEEERTPIVVTGIVGPRGDGYDPAELMSATEAEAYHSRQIATFADTAADMVTAVTMTHADEAVGVVRAAAGADVPVAISFTLETDGRLPSGQELADAVEQVDAETGRATAYFMVNCAHPTHFAHVLLDEGAWRERIGGLRANASAKSHAELDAAEELDEGDPIDLGAQHRALRARLPSVGVLGGCCGTDHRHVAQISDAWQAR
jgi:S-methylmethionine-dependent homocysteine/selenocysteine methylase